MDNKKLGNISWQQVQLKKPCHQRWK